MKKEAPDELLAIECHGLLYSLLAGDVTPHVLGINGVGAGRFVPGTGWPFDLIS